MSLKCTVMAEENKNLKNHQLLEKCGVNIFKKIERKKIIEKSSTDRGFPQANTKTDKK